jgi:hypothetical protein
MQKALQSFLLYWEKGYFSKAFSSRNPSLGEFGVFWGT